MAGGDLGNGEEVGGEGGKFIGLVCAETAEGNQFHGLGKAISDQERDYLKVP